MAEADFSLFQLVADQLVSIVGSEIGNGSGPRELGRKLIVSDLETNDIHVGVSTIFLNPAFFLSQPDQKQVIKKVFALSEEFDSEREVRTRQAVNRLTWDLRIAMKRLYDLDPTALDRIIKEEYLGEPTEDLTLHLSPIEP